MMLKTLRAILVGGSAAVALAGSAVSSDQPAAPRPCAFVKQINNFKALDDRSAIIETSPSRRFKVTFFNTCRELRWAWSMRIDARPGVCLSPGDALIASGNGIPERCIIQTIEALPPETRQP